MDYNNINDEELVYLINENSEDAKDLLYEKYYYIVDIYVKKYAKTALSLGVDIKDLRQEALLGLSEAINDYDANNNASFKTFVSICVERKIQSAIIKAGRLKNKMLNDALSLEYQYNEGDLSLADVISDDNKNNPLEKVADEEAYFLLKENIEKSLSEAEKEVYNLMILGFDYRQIADILKMNLKAVDNARERIKAKAKKEIAKIN